MLSKYSKLLRSPLTPVYRLLVQPPAILLLPLALRIPLPSHGWTVINLLFKLAAGFRILSGNFDIYLLLLLWGGMVADSVDGPVARHRDSSSFFGAYLDRLADRMAASFILSTLFINLWLQINSNYVLLLGIAVIGVDILHETLRCWVSMTGGILERRDPLPGWEKKLRKLGLIPMYGHDTLFLIVGAGGLLFEAQQLGFGIFVLSLLSFLYQIGVHWRGARQCGGVGFKYYRQLLKKLLMRLAAMALAVSAGWLLLESLAYNPGIWLWVFIWIDFYIFYIPANYYMSLSADIPAEPEPKSKYIERMQQADEQFLFRIYP